MEMADRVVVWLRAGDGPRSFDDIHRMLAEHHPDVTVPIIQELLGGLSEHRFVARLGQGRYTLPALHAAPSGTLPSTYVEEAKPPTKRARLIEELGRMGGQASTGELAQRLVALNVVRSYEEAVALMREALRRRELRQPRRGFYETVFSPAKADSAPPPPPEAHAESCEAPAPEKSAEEEGTEAPSSPDQAKLAELIAEKRARFDALDIERKDFERVRAHLGDLMAHNREDAERTAGEIEGLERMHRLAGLIRQTIDLG